MTDGSSRHCRSPFAAFQSPRIDLLSVTSRATILNDPSRYGRNREIPDNPYQHEYYVSRIRSIRYKIRVFQCHNILFQHQLENPLKVAPLIQSNLTPVKFFHSFILFILIFFVFFLSVMPGSTLNFVYKYNDSFLLLHLRSDSPKSSIRIA